MPRSAPKIGVRIAGTGCHYPEARFTNADFEKIMDTTDEWIVQRTGIRERRVCDTTRGENVHTLSLQALRKALADAGMSASELDLIIVGSVTGEMRCPSTACRVAADVGAGNAGAFDVLAACTGFVYGLNVGHDMIRSGSVRNVAVIGCDVMSSVMDYDNRGVAILFGDAAGAAILRATDDTTRGVIASGLHAEGTRWKDLFIPRAACHFPEGLDADHAAAGGLHMNGREVYKFAVGTFSSLIETTLNEGGLTPSDVDMYICHQSNARMLESARERLNIPPERLYVNIDRFGNCSAGSVPVCLDELRKNGACREDDIVMFVAFGGGMTWASSLWRL